MCGIAGLIGSDRSYQATIEAVRHMCDCIVYRGPDEEGLWAEGHVGLGMRRLSIIDLSGGSQPIYNEDRSVLTVFNGEIYNFVELRAELESSGHRFCSRSDTEVIVHLYEELATNFVQRLRGMFALAVYDKRRNKLVLARDRLGKKPLHYAVHNGVLYFGSEIKSLLAAEPRLADLDNNGLMQFFYYGYIPDPKTAFRSVCKLPPGHWLEFTDGTVRVERYWELPQFGGMTLDENECLQRMEKTLADAVRMRLISDVPLGALLSGGVDSSTVVAMMARVSNAPVKTFSIGFSNADFNEAPHARAVAEKFGTEHHELMVDANLWDTLNMITGKLDEPFGDSSMIPTYHVSRMARQYVTVVLSGDGGDELFAGYDRYLAHYRRRHLDLLPGWFGSFYRRDMYPLLPSRVRSRKLAYNLGLKARDRFVDAMSVLSTRDDGLSVLSREFTNSVAGTPPERVLQRYYDEAPASDLVSRMQFADIKTYMTADILTKVDRMSMLASLEVRVPLLDHVFVELVAGFPVSLKVRSDVRKYLLLKLAERLGVPRHVLYRPKQGFSLPLVHWMRSELKQEVTALLLEPRTIQRGYLRRSGIERVLSEHHQGRRDHSAAIWALLVFELWHRNFLERLRNDMELPSAAGVRL